jgi:hypothetical protein
MKTLNVINKFANYFAVGIVRKKDLIRNLSHVM